MVSTTVFVARGRASTSDISGPICGSVWAGLGVEVSIRGMGKGHWFLIGGNLSHVVKSDQVIEVRTQMVGPRNG